MTWERNTSRIAVRAPLGRERRRSAAGRWRATTTPAAPLRGSAATSSRASTLPATTTGAAIQLRWRARGRWPAATSALPPSVPPVEQHDVGPRSATQRVRSSGAVSGPACTCTTLPPLDRATRRPASAVTSSLVADDGDPQAAAGARAGQDVAARPPARPAGQRRQARRRRRRGRRCRSSSGARRRRRAAPSARSTSDALVNVEPKSTQTTGPAASRRSGEGPVEVGDQVVGGLDADDEPDQVGGHLERRCRPRWRGSSGRGARSATRRRRATRRA